MHKNMSNKPDFGEWELTYDVSEEYVKNWSMTQIKKEPDLHQEEVKRHVRKALKWFVENYEGSSDETGKKL